jgi:hypothetical protein
MFDAGPCSRLLVLPVFIDAREPRFSESALLYVRPVLDSCFFACFDAMYSSRSCSST